VVLRDSVELHYWVCDSLSAQLMSKQKTINVPSVTEVTLVQQQYQPRQQQVINNSSSSNSSSSSSLGETSTVSLFAPTFSGSGVGQLGVLPSHVFRHILTFLQGSSLARLCTVSNTIRRLIRFSPDYAIIRMELVCDHMLLTCPMVSAEDLHDITWWRANGYKGRHWAVDYQYYQKQENRSGFQQHNH
jgi:hypothetical protein